MSFPPAPPAPKKPSLLSYANLKKLRWPALVMAMTGGPYAYFESGGWTDAAANAWNEWSAPTVKTSAVTTPTPLASAGLYGSHQTGAAGNAAPTALAELFDFQVSPAWVADHWPEVSLGMADVKLTGHRVMLVTGSQPRDLAGSLTYYFDDNGALQRIRFEGVTGDPRPLVAEMALKHRFVRCRTDVPGGEIFQVHRDGKAAGELRIRSVPVLKADSVLGRYSVSLAIDRPSS